MSLGAEQQRHRAGGTGRRPDRHRVGAWGQGREPEPVLPQGPESSRPVVDGRERHPQDVAHRHADAAPVERVRAARAEQHAVDPQRGGVAEQRTEVLVIPDPFQHGQHPCPGGEVGHRRAGGTVGDGEHPPVQVEAHHPRHGLGRGHVRGHGHVGQVACQLLDPPSHPEQRADRVGRGEQSAHHHRSLRDHQPPPAGPVGPAVGGGEVAEVVEPRVGHVVGVDH